MLNPGFLVSRFGRLVCPKCKHSPIGTALVYGQGFLPIGGSSAVGVQVHFRCAKCGCVRIQTRVISRAEVLSMFSDAIDSGASQTCFHVPCIVPVAPVPRPSIAPTTPRERITRSEVEQAKRILHRISFKPGSNSWEEFLKRLEADGDR